MNESGASDDDLVEQNAEEATPRFPSIFRRDGGLFGGIFGRRDAGTGTGTRDASTGTPADAGTDSGHGGHSGGGNTNGLPCDVAPLVQKYCGTCHGDPPVSAPFSLVSAEDFQSPGFSDSSKTTAQLAYERMNTTNTQRKMPPPSASAQPTAAELQKINAWLQGGAKASTETCDGGTPNPGGDPIYRGGSGGASNKKITYEDKDIKCYEFRGFASAANKSQKYSVPTTPDLYVAFNIRAPWTGTQYIKSIRSLIDNGRVLHHWLLFRQLNGGSEGVKPNSSGTHPDGEMLYGWAPGGEDIWFDPDVGMEVASGQLFQLETHYNNTTGRASPDASGVEICVTPHKPAHVASLSWIGTDSINGTSASGNCTPDTNQQIHLVAAQPHMHLKGRHMKVMLTRANGRQETLHDAPFNFDYQRTYLLNGKTMGPGDKLTTTCTYSERARFGKGTEQEMCYFFTIAWPAGALKQNSFYQQLHGPNTCIGLR